MIILPERDGLCKTVPFIGSNIEAAAYREIAEVLQREQGLCLSGYKELCIKRRLAARIRAVGCPDSETYLQRLRSSTVEQEQLLAALSIHVSQFFRNPKAFRVLEKRVLPALLEAVQGRRGKLRLWSAGCARGEEAYTLALLCRERITENRDVAIIGTDLSPQALRQAKQGCFPAERLTEVPAALLERYFVRRGERYQVVDGIREMVRFFRHDILGDQPFYRADLILCRNLLIYFSRPQQQRILEQLAAALLPGGYLMLGRAETLPTGCRSLLTCIDPAERLYQRTAVEIRQDPSDNLRGVLRGEGEAARLCSAEGENHAC